MEIIAPDDKTQGLWNLLFKDHAFCKAALDKSIYFTLLGGWDGYHALMVTNRGRSRISQMFWLYFKESLQQPYRIDESKAQVEFPEHNIILNIHNLIYTFKYHDVVVANHHRLIWEYFKNGIIPAKSVTISTYGEDEKAYFEAEKELNFSPKIEERCGGYQLTFLVMRQPRVINVVRSVTNTWP